MTKASQYPESKRRQRTLDDFEREWWWFCATNARETNEAALAWETLRRTKFYPALWRKCLRERSTFLGNEGKPPPKNVPASASSVRSKLSELFQRMHLVGRAKQATSDQFFGMILNGFDPTLTWLGLTERQRLTARGYSIADMEAVKVAPEYTLPRQSSHPSFAAEISLCEIDRNSDGQLILSKGSGTPLAEVTRFPFFQALNLKIPGRYLCVYFDTRFGRETLLAALREQKQFWMPDLHSGSRLKSDEVHVIPSDMPPFAIFLAPAKCDAARLLAAFHTQLKSAQRGDWFPRCVAHWETVKVEVEMVVPKADGRVEIDCRGFPVLTKVTRYLFNPKEHLPPEQKARKSASRVNLWLGLAANDLRKARLPLGKQSEPGQFLLRHCDRVHNLRNHQRSAKARLDELDRTFGRLDKNLDHWINENERLSKIGFFFAAAAPPTSNVRKVIIPRKPR